MMIFQWSILVLTLVQIYASKHRLARQTAQDICPNPDVAFCDFIQCANGRCVEDKASSECFKCECDVGFTGFLCETAIVTPTECNLNCQNGGLCVQPSANISICACPPGFTGSECETSVLSTHPCVTMPTTVCQNGGICTQDGDGYLCNCPPGWNGKNCETQAIVTQCEANTCGQHGICIQATTQNGPIVLCNCENRWTGKFCDVNLDDVCSMGFCLSGGVCVTAGNVPICQCPPAYTGIRCETLLGTGSISSTTTTTTTITTTTNSILTQTPGNCSTKPCLNGGSCYNAGNSFICLCRQQWTGTTCNTPNAGAITTTAVTPLPNDACASNPCENGGTCYKLGNGGFICVCTAGFTGDQCTVPRTTTAPSVTDPTSITCRNQPCENGGTCYSAGNSYFCFCGSKSNFTGKNCETPISTLAADCPLKCAPGQCVRTGGSNQNTYACMCNGILKPTSCS